jgi:hypothetical protein
LNKKQFSTFVDHIRKWAFDKLEMHIPNPEDKQLGDFYNEYNL